MTKKKPQAEKKLPPQNMPKFTKENIYPLALQYSLDTDNAFIADITALLPCSHATFYLLFPNGSDELETLKKNIENNKIAIKKHLRKRWKDSDNPTLQISLYKLLADENELARLSNTKFEDDSGRNQIIGFKFVVDTDAKD